MSLCFKLNIHNIQLSLDFIKLFSHPVNFLLLVVNFNTVACFDILLNFHSHDVSVNGQAHFVGHLINLALLLLNSTTHVTQAGFKSKFELFLGLHFLAQTFLVVR